MCRVGCWCIDVVVGCIWTNWVSKDNFGNCISRNNDFEHSGHVYIS